MEFKQLQNILEAAIFAAHSPLPLSHLASLFDKIEQPSNDELRAALAEIEAAYEGRGVELKLLGSGYQFQSRADYSPWIQKLWEERAPKYSRATLETLVLIAYRQPITRAEIESVRGVAVSTNIIKNLLDREWVRVVGQREVPGRPSLYGTTKQFLDYFNLKGLTDLPDLEEIVNLENAETKLMEQLDLAVDVQNETVDEPSQRQADSEFDEGLLETTDEPDESEDRLFEISDESDKVPFEMTDKNNAVSDDSPAISETKWQDDEVEELCQN